MTSCTKLNAEQMSRTAALPQRSLQSSQLLKASRQHLRQRPIFAALRQRFSGSTPAVSSPASTVTMSAAPEVTTKPLLLGNWACPYVQRVWTALNHKGVDYNYAEVDLQQKPEWFLTVSPLGKVPVITYRDEQGKTVVLHESLTLLEYVNEQYKGPDLLPTSPVERACARIIINRFDQRAIAAWSKLSYQTKEEKDADAAKALGKELGDELTWLEGQLDADGPYFLGKDFSNVDAAIAPWLLRAHVLEAIRGYKIFKGHPRLQAYAVTLRKSPAIEATLKPPAGQGMWEDALHARSTKRFKVHHFTF